MTTINFRHLTCKSLWRNWFVAFQLKEVNTFYFLFLFVFKHKKVRDIQDYNSVRIFPNTITDNKAIFIRLQAIL